MPATPRQPDLFDSPEFGEAPGPAERPVIPVPAGAARLSKAQKSFNQLTARLARLREHLAAWQAATDAMQARRAAELAPASDKLRQAQREMLLWVDAHLRHPPPGERTTKPARAKLVAVLRMLARAVLAEGPDAEVEAAHDRHSAQTYREHQREEADMAAAIFGQAMGNERLFEGEAESVEALMQRAAERLKQQAKQAEQAEQADEPEARPPGHRPSRAEKARDRDAAALKQASQSVREVYRRLASDLHPDREPDAAERERKTALMARVNQAYEANDLLALLTLQLELEHIDAATLARLPDDRLRHYNRVLQEQEQSLQAELAVVQMPVAESLETPPGGLAWPPSMAFEAFEADLGAVKAALRYARADFEQLRSDPRTRAVFLRQLQVEDPDDSPSPMEAMLAEAMMDGILDAMPQQPAPRRGAAKRRRR